MPLPSDFAGDSRLTTKQSPASQMLRCSCGSFGLQGGKGLWVRDNLVPEVLRFFGQRLVTRRDSEENIYLNFLIGYLVALPFNCIALPHTVHLHLSKALFSMDPDNLQLHFFKDWEHCSVVRSFALSTNHVTRCKRYSSLHRAQNPCGEKNSRILF